MLNSDERNTVIARVLKLSKLNTENATEAEAQAAALLISKLLDAHQIQQAELEAKAKSEGTAPEKVFTGMAVAGHTKGYCYWERQLAESVSKLVGGVFCFGQSSDDSLPLTISNLADEFAGLDNGNLKKHRYLFYGSPEDVAICVEMFKSWSATIGTMAVQRYGTAYRKEGYAFSCGFIRSLQLKVHEAKKETANSQAGATSLAVYCNLKREESKEYAIKVTGFEFTTTTRKVKVSDDNAYQKGKEVGSKADFQVKRTAKLGSAPKMLTGGK